jgi:hypothetical protein
MQRTITLHGVDAEHPIMKGTKSTARKTSDPYHGHGVVSTSLGMAEPGIRDTYGMVQH